MEISVARWALRLGKDFTFFYGVDLVAIWFKVWIHVTQSKSTDLGIFG